MSQENVSDKVRNLQKQIAQGIKFGQRPSSLRRSEGDEGSSDEEEVPRSPLKVLAQVEAEPPKTEPKVQGAQASGQHSTPVKSPRSKRVLPPTGTIESINLDAVPQSVPLLDNTAAKHKLSVKPKNQRVSRKHRRFTLDLQEVSVHDELEAAGISSAEPRRASVDESRESLKKQRLHEAEIQDARRRRELEEQWFRKEEEERAKKAEELRLEEERCRRNQQEEQERRQREEAEGKRREEERRIREEEEKRREEAERRRREERRIREEEERRRNEEAERARKAEEERKMREEEERRRQEEEEQLRKLEEERKRREEEDHRQREEKRRQQEEQKRKQEEERLRRLQELEAEKKRKQKEEEEERKKREEAETLKLREIEEKKKLEEGERMRRHEELRWKEMEERQRPFSFKVSSGEKQILFQKVNLTPVTPASGHQGAAAADQREGAKASSPEGPESPCLPASPCVPHTAILVTGAQLCGTAVNLDHIKDTACKSLLGLGEDRKAQGAPQAKGKTSPDRKSGKTKSLNESALASDQSSAAVLAEWASIRSKIFKGVEDGKYDEYPEPAGRTPPQPGGPEEQPPFAHANLRKTMSASAKFSITPARKKFGDSNRNSEAFAPEDREAGEDGPAAAPAAKPQSRPGKTVRIAERGADECMFAKDLPSFLVPSPGERPDGPEPHSRLQGDSEASEGKAEGEREGEARGLDGDDQPSPFGIKLRRTNYSLRFHSEQSAEKRKKRYSAGDSFDGVPSPLTPMEPDSDASSVFSDRSTPTSPQKEGAVSKYLLSSASPGTPRGRPGKSPSPTPHHQGEKAPPKPSVYKRPTASPKPTPPPSPLPKALHGPPGEDPAPRTGGAAETSGREQAGRSKEPSAVAQLHRSGHGPAQGEEEPKEKRSFFPSLNIPWREKTDRKAELIRREKPSLQSRHSLDSAKVQEKEAGPLWITLALQKQKGFREQQQNRDDRRSQREAKLAEKQTRDRDSLAPASPTDSKGSGSVSPSSKPQTPEEPKRPDSLLGRFERREVLKKANTLPSSVTVEIADSTPSPPSVKDVSKRFPSSDSPQVSTEPAWLALAKRKAKAWSDCPQIIK
ncbi:capping protein inhibiting regulator of actin dynamics isoform 3-T4 [Menidia menidia]